MILRIVFIIVLFSMAIAILLFSNRNVRKLTLYAFKFYWKLNVIILYNSARDICLGQAFHALIFIYRLKNNKGTRNCMYSLHLTCHTIEQ